MPVGHSELTRSESRQIENIQKASFKIISYKVACTILGAEPLELRRTHLCLKFAKKDIKKTYTLFQKTEKTTITICKQIPVVEPKCRPSRFEKSSIPYLSRILNRGS